jgi:nicotinic acid phosphoribosyltransferase
MALNVTLLKLIRYPLGLVTEPFGESTALYQDFRHETQDFVCKLLRCERGTFQVCSFVMAYSVIMKKSAFLHISLSIYIFCTSKTYVHM